MDPESENFVVCSERIVLECKGCGEKLILLGLEDDWRSEQTIFECECGENPSLEDRTDEEALAIRDLLQGGRISGN